MIIGKQKIEDPVKFSEASYQENNKWAIDFFTDILIKEGYSVLPKLKEDYWIDIQATKNGKKYLFEVEIKGGVPFTDEISFNYPTVSFLSRKKKWANNKFWYVIICRQTESFVLCNSSEIYKDCFKETFHISTSERQGMDTFYRLPKKECMWNTLKEIK